MNAEDAERRRRGRGEVARIAAASPDLRAERVEQLQRLFPEAVTEGGIDFEKLRELLGEAVAGGPERFGFTWAGKREAIRALQTPSAATLVPAPEESVDFETTRNLFVEGDNLEVLKLLQRSYFGRVKLIYIDPPYNTGNDFIYPDDFAHPLARYLEITGQRDAAGNLLSSNPETSGRYHSAWLSMLYPRLALARQLLREDGVIFVSIDDHEVHTLRLLMNELFGEERFQGAFVWRRRSGAMDAANGLSTDHEYVLCYGNGYGNGYGGALSGQRRTFERYANPDNDPRGRWVADNLSAAKPGGDTWYAVEDPATGRTYWPPKGRYWPYNPETMRRKIAEGRILFPKGPGGSPLLKRFQSEARSLVRPISSWIASAGEDGNHPGGDHDGEAGQLAAAINSEGTREIKQLFGDKVFLYPKPVSLLRALIEQGTSAPGDDGDTAEEIVEEIVLDFFAGSATTAQAVLELNAENGGNRRFLLVQLPEPTGNPEFPTIAEIGKERIRRVAARLRGAAGVRRTPLQAPTHGDSSGLKSADTGRASRESAPVLLPGTHELRADLGFRVFKLAPSHLRRWQGFPADDGDAYVAQLGLFADPLAADADPLDAIWEVALREGYSLTSQIEKIPGVVGQTVYRVADPDKGQAFTICLDDSLRIDALRPLRLTTDDLFVCRDSALDDTAAANLALECRMKTI